MNSKFLYAGEVLDHDEIKRRLTTSEATGDGYPKHFAGEPVRVLDYLGKISTHFVVRNHYDHANACVFTSDITGKDDHARLAFTVHQAGRECLPVRCIKTNARQALDRLRERLDRGFYDCRLV